jgi:DNA-binding GntR family transcriptional regulator
MQGLRGRGIRIFNPYGREGMDLTTFESSTTSPLAKDTIAALIREEIIAGKLRPGELIVERNWALQLKVAQASIREAINILVAEGFVNKRSGSSARITLLTLEDVAQIYQVRSVLEGLAARLLVENRAELRDLHQAVFDIRSAAECNNMRALSERDLAFHLLLCRKSGNSYLAQNHRRLVVPLFAFVITRVHKEPAWSRHWRRCAAEEHQEIIEAVRSGEPSNAEEHVKLLIETMGNDMLTYLKSKGADQGQLKVTHNDLLQRRRVFSVD